MTLPGERPMVALLLTAHLVPVAARPLKASEFWRLYDRFEELESLLDQGPETIERLLATSVEEARRIHELLGRAAPFAFELEDFHRRGIRVVSAIDDEYPTRLRARLGDSAPPVLYIAGSAELLTRPSFGIVGSRDVDPNAAAAAREAATMASARGLAVCSGAAKGIDQVAMNAAFAADGTVVGILADSLERKLRDPDTRRAVMDDRVCLFTPYKPSLGFTVANAMARNKLIYALAERTFVVQSDLERGGTWTGAVEWLKREPSEVAVWIGAGKGSGNDALVSAGAMPVQNVGELFDFGKADAGSSKAQQLGFRV